MTSSQTPNRIVDQWFQIHGWKPFQFQRSSWNSYQTGTDFLLHSSTGSGKTYAAWMGPIRQFLHNPQPQANWIRRRGQPTAPPLTVLWITPLRALSADTATALRLPIDELQLPWTLDIRTGDSSSAARSRQRKHLPTALITTPESLTILLSYPESFQHFHHLKAIVVDEWHELMGTKRGTQTELALARLSRIAPAAVRMGLSATLANQQQALHYLVGNRRQAEAKLIRGAKARPIQIRSILPPKIESFPWAGHLGLSMVQPVVETIQQCQTSLVFTNTRNQAERWYQELLKKRPDWAGRLALHHGSLDRQTRSWVENAMREGKLLATVCTSSLDLGVDFPTVEQVIQIGSPKGVARLIQRAGKSEHRPGLSSRLGFVPTNVLELLELASARKILRNASRMEARVPIQNPLDCLAQHAVTLALANPYSFREFAEEARDCASYRDLQDEQLKWIFQYLIHGGESLSAYPEFHKVEHRDGHFQVLPLPDPPPPPPPPRRRRRCGRARL